jgi:RNA polymerase sigma-70 factor (ECF subfamily)
MPEDVVDGALRPETRLIATGEVARMAECFELLPGDRAQAVRGAYLQGLSYTDLAARFDVPLNTMRTWLRRSLMSLRDCLDR